MWRTKDGQINTVSVPNPGMFFAPEALESVMALFSQTKKSKTRNRLDRLANKELDAVLRLPFSKKEEERYVSEIPPLEVFSVRVSDWPDLEEKVGHIPRRWRIDVLTALSELS